MGPRATARPSTADRCPKKGSPSTKIQGEPNTPRAIACSPCWRAMLFISGSAIPAEQRDLGDDHVAVLPHRRHPMGLEPEPLPDARLHHHRPAPPLVMQNEQDTRGGVVPLRRVQVASDRNTGHFWETSPKIRSATPTSTPTARGTRRWTTSSQRSPERLLPGCGRGHPG